MGKTHDTVLYARAVDPFFEPLPRPVSPFIDRLGYQPVKASHAGGGAEWICIERAGVAYAVAYVPTRVIAVSDCIHDLTTTRGRGAGQAASEDLTKGTQIRLDAESSLCTAGTHPKAGDHFIEDKQRTKLPGHLTQALKIRSG